MTVQVVHGHEGQAAAPGERLGGGEADQQRADQARALGDGNGLDVVERGAGFGKRLRTTAMLRWCRDATSGTTPPSAGAAGL